MKNWGAMFVALGCVLLTQCLGSSDVGDSLQSRVLASLSERVTLAYYREFEASAEQLVAQATGFCAEPDKDGLTAVRDAWWAARGPWKRAEVVKFGPVVEYPFRLGPLLDDWPVNEKAVESLLSGDTGLELADFQAMGSATRGLPVVEYLLWSHGNDTLGQFVADSRRCEVLMGVSADVHANAKTLADVWESDWLPLLSDPGPMNDDTYKRTQDVVDEWVNRMTFTVENIRITKLGKPAGDSSRGLPQPDIIESRYSGRSIMDARDALAGVSGVWTGAPGDGSLGIKALVRRALVIQQINDAFQGATERLAAVPEPLEEAVLSASAQIKLAQEALKELQILIQTELATALDTTLAFNDADGD